MFSDEDRQLLLAGAEDLKVTLDSLAVDRFELYSDRLREENQRINLTRVPPEDTITLHFLDSLAISRVVKIGAGTRMLDLGTGAGFPGLPLAIAHPSISMTLMDSTLKRLNFLDRFITEAGIGNVRIVHGRAEDLKRSDLYRAFDIVTARAVAGMEQLAGWMIPFIAQSGCAVAYKSENGRDEIEAANSTIELLGGRLDRIELVKLPGTEITRLLAIISVSKSAPNAVTLQPRLNRPTAHRRGSSKEKR